jgi:hypothetical protein
MLWILLANEISSVISGHLKSGSWRLFITTINLCQPAESYPTKVTRWDSSASRRIHTNQRRNIVEASWDRVRPDATSTVLNECGFPLSAVATNFAPHAYQGSKGSTFQIQRSFGLLAVTSTPKAERHCEPRYPVAHYLRNCVGE